MNKTQTKYLIEITRAVTGGQGPMPWQEIVALCNELGFDKTKHKEGWLWVRDIIATAAHNGLIRRTKDVHNEEYIAGDNLLSDFGLEDAA